MAEGNQWFPSSIPVVGDIINGFSQGIQNRKNRQHDVDMFNLTNKRADEVHDRDRNEAYFDWNQQNQYNEGLWNKQNEYNERMWQQQNLYNEGLWNKQNAYNSPMAQMERFKEAGLNPNLIYGQSNSGGSISSATLQADTQQHTSFADKSSNTSTAGNTAGRPVNFDMSNGILAMADFRNKSAQTNNLEEQNNLIRQQSDLVKLQGIKTSAETEDILAGKDTKRFELGLKSDLRQINMDAARESLRKSQMENDLILSKWELEQARAKWDFKKAGAEIAHLNELRLTTRAEGELHRLDAELKKQGIQPHDWIWERTLKDWWNRAKETGKRYSLGIGD